MAKLWFSADDHLGHPNIVVYANRPWLKEGDLKTPFAGHGKPDWTSGKHALECGRRMTEGIIRNHNECVREDDIHYHIGDFCTRGNARGVPSLAFTAYQYEQQLNGRLVHIQGNHDKNNGVKHALDYAVVTFANKSWLLMHNPYDAMDLTWSVDAVLCGHVHTAWHYTVRNSIPFINVGVDVNNYHPIDIGEVMKLYTKAIKEYDVRGDI